MRCPSCAEGEDRVVDSRSVGDGAAIRRRRECLACAHRYTTFERIEEAALAVVKRDGRRQQFERSKVAVGLELAAKGRPFDDELLETIAADVEDWCRVRGPEVSSDDIGKRVLAHLRERDEVAYLRFASVHKSFDNASDFVRESVLLATDPPT